jgi:hypothetical protein
MLSSFIKDRNDSGTCDDVHAMLTLNLNRKKGKMRGRFHVGFVRQKRVITSELVTCLPLGILRDSQ